MNGDNRSLDDFRRAYRVAAIAAAQGDFGPAATYLDEVRRTAPGAAEDVRREIWNLAQGIEAGYIEPDGEWFRVDFRKARAYRDSQREPSAAADGVPLP